MSHSHREDDHPQNLDHVVRRLRAERAEASALELDEIKRTAVARASRDKGGLGVRNLGALWRARFTTLALTLALIVSGGAAGAIAGGKGGHGKGADKGQYCKPKKGKGHGGDDDPKHGGKHACPDTDSDSDKGSDKGSDKDSDKGSDKGSDSDSDSDSD
jgi:hypothetical protein